MYTTRCRGQSLLDLFTVSSSPTKWVRQSDGFRPRYSWTWLQTTSATLTTKNLQILSAHTLCHSYGIWCTIPGIFHGIQDYDDIAGFSENEGTVTSLSGASRTFFRMLIHKFGRNRRTLLLPIDSITLWLILTAFDATRPSKTLLSFLQAVYSM